MTESGRNVFKFATEVDTEVRVLCEMALDLALASRASDVVYQFRSIDVGTPITSVEEPDFTVEAFMEEELPDYIDSCDVATTVFDALLRSQSRGSRPIRMIEKAAVIACEGPRMELGLNSPSCGYMQSSLDFERPIEWKRADVDLVSRSRNVVTRRIADEL